jgi:hypothetical protein
MTKLSVLSILVMIQLACFLEAIPSESEMKKIFNSSRDEFEDLVQNLKQDKNVVQISAEGVFYDDQDLSPLSHERLSFYRERMKKLRVNVAVHRDNKTSFRLIVFASAPSLAWPRREMSFAYRETEPTAIVESVDKYVSLFKQPPVYQRLADRWYIAYESW